MNVKHLQSYVLPLMHLKNGAFKDVTDYTLFRFLRTGKFNVETATKAFQNYIQWRTDNNIDTVLQRPVPKIEQIKKLVPYAYHGYDNEGRPIYYERTGKMLCDVVASQSVVTLEEFKFSHVWGLENLSRLSHEKSLETGKRVETVATVIDMNGLGWQHKDAIPLLTACTEIDNAYYPERIGKIYLLNLPWIAPALYQLVVPLVDPVIKSRLHPVSGDPASFLPSVIPPEHLPVEYGGTCKCEKNGGLGCVPQYDASDITSGAANRTLPDGYKTEKVDYEFEQTVECDADGGVFSWWFESDEGYDIDFSITLVPENGTPVEVKPASRCVTSSGSHECKQKAKMIFKWDNNFSYFYSKDLKYLLSISKSDLDLPTSANPTDISSADLKASAASATAKQ